MSIIAIGIGLYFLFSAVVVVSVCMISSQFSQQEGLVEDWTTQEWTGQKRTAPKWASQNLAYEKKATAAKQEVTKATRYA